MAAKQLGIDRSTLYRELAACAHKHPLTPSLETDKRFLWAAVVGVADERGPVSERVADRLGEAAHINVNHERECEKLL